MTGSLCEHSIHDDQCKILSSDEIRSNFRLGRYRCSVLPSNRIHPALLAPLQGEDVSVFPAGVVMATGDKDEAERLDWSDSHQLLRDCRPVRSGGEGRCHNAAERK